MTVLKSLNQTLLVSAIGMILSACSGGGDSATPPPVLDSNATAQKAQVRVDWNDLTPAGNCGSCSNPSAESRNKDVLISWNIQKDSTANCPGGGGAVNATVKRYHVFARKNNSNVRIPPEHSDGNENRTTPAQGPLDDYIGAVEQPNLNNEARYSILFSAVPGAPTIVNGDTWYFRLMVQYNESLFACDTYFRYWENNHLFSATASIPAATGFSNTGTSSGILSYNWNAISGQPSNGYNLYLATNQADLNDNSDIQSFSPNGSSRLLFSGTSRPTNAVVENGRLYYAAVAGYDATSVGFGAFTGPHAAAASSTEQGAKGRLNDTGVEWYADGTTNNLGSQPSGYADQDATMGKKSANSNKRGSGESGFDFTKLDNSGNPLAASASSWNCVYDNNSGLTWQVKTNKNNTAGESLDDTDDVFSWYDSNAQTNGGNAGLENSTSTCFGFSNGNAATYCNTQAYIARVNASNLCGHSDWRLPNKIEFSSLLHYGRFSPAPAVDDNYFAGVHLESRYWTSATSLNNTREAWTYVHNSGNDAPFYKLGTASVRLVRGQFQRF